MNTISQKEQAKKDNLAKNVKELFNIDIIDIYNSDPNTTTFFESLTLRQAITYYKNYCESKYNHSLYNEQQTIMQQYNITLNDVQSYCDRWFLLYGNLSRFEKLQLCKKLAKI